MVRFLRFSFLPVVAMLCLCRPYYLTTQRVGALFPVRESCHVEFENITMAEAQAKYSFIGLVTISGASSSAFTEKMKADVTTKACEMGGDVVCLNGSFDNTANYGGGAGFQMAVFRKPDSSIEEKAKEPGSGI